ncbi:CATRA conflict system CASPASE/TPR repeat-associated protein [Actinoplanes sp. NPDC051411]|uniref:CATRA conflict system CASPASE/TPR repeat-associated protein n=1 Tax=Actinoplanes sp. NPDC051411 TaxID=3155522 RepID=UPI00341E1C32
MPGSALPEQEFVAHIFAPLAGPRADDAYAEIGRLWARCRDQLDLSEPILTGVPAVLPPARPRDGRDGPVAGLQDRAVSYQLIARCEGDMLNVSLVFASPPAPPIRRVRIGSASPPGWAEFARWWSQLTVGGLGAVLGSGLVFQAKRPPSSTDWNAWGAEAWAAIPPSEDDAAEWWRRPSEVTPGVVVWDVTSGRDSAHRRLVILAEPERDAAMSALTWSSGGSALPPLGRYLMHAARLRYESRVRGDGGQLLALRRRVELTANRIEPGDSAAPLASDEALLVGTLDELTSMRRTVEAGARYMRAVLPELLPADDSLQKWLRKKLADDVEVLEAARVRAAGLRKLAGGGAPGQRASTLLDPPAVAATPISPLLTDLVETRLGFGVDVIGYSKRPAPLKSEVQQRVAGLIGQVLDDVGLRLDETDRQDAGDGLMVVMPAKVELHRALPRLLFGWRNRLAVDNQAHRDRLRLRVSASVGPFARSALGFSGDTIIEIGRMLDSPPLRRTMVDRPELDVAALVSERLYQDVVGEGWPELAPEQFEHLEVEVKDFRRRAWLWTGDDRDGLSAGLVRELRAAATKVIGWQLAELRWRLVERTLQVALDAMEASDEDALGSAVGELELLGPVRQGRVGGGPTLPCPAPIQIQARRLVETLDVENR